MNVLHLVYEISSNKNHFQTKQFWDYILLLQRPRTKTSKGAARAKFLSSFTFISGLFVNTLWSIYVPWYVLSEYLIIVLTFPQLCLYLCLFVPQVACLKLFAGLLWHIHAPFFINKVLSKWEQRLVDKLTKYICTFHSHGPSIFCSKNGLSFSYRFQLKF